jgi:hypothetical protein
MCSTWFTILLPIRAGICRWLPLIDLLVLPDHEETRIEHFLSGKMVARLVRKMPCSVLLVKQEPVMLCET